MGAVSFHGGLWYRPSTTTVGNFTEVASTPFNITWRALFLQMQKLRQQKYVFRLFWDWEIGENSVFPPAFTTSQIRKPIKSYTELRDLDCCIEKPIPGRKLYLAYMRRQLCQVWPTLLADTRQQPYYRLTSITNKSETTGWPTLPAYTRRQL